MTTTIPALDLGTTTGWALRGSDGHITSGSQSFRPQRFEGGGMRFPALQTLAHRRSSNRATASTACTSRRCVAVSTDAAHAYGAVPGHNSRRGVSTTRSRTRRAGRHDQEARPGKGNAGKERWWIRQGRGHQACRRQRSRCPGIALGHRDSSL